MANPLVHVGVEVGDGLVARFGDAVVLVVGPGEHRHEAEDLLAAVEAAVSGTGSSAAGRSAAGTSDLGPPGANVARGLAAIVAGGPGTTLPFGAVAPLGDGYVVLLHGPVSAEVSSPLGVVQLSGEQAVTWVDYKVEVPVDRLSVTSRDHPVHVDPMSDLRAGLVPGSGFVITPGQAGDEAAAATAAGTGAAVAATRPASSSTGGRAAATTLEPRREGTTLEPRREGATTLEPRREGATTLEPRREGDEVRPETSALRPASGSPRATEALSQAVGHLVAADGLRIPLDRAYVLGREPEADPAVQSGSATPVRLSDDENLISRVHSYVTVESGQVRVQDAASANGTFVAAAGDEAWARIGDEPVELPPTWSLRVGNQVFTYVAAATP